MLQRYHPLLKIPEEAKNTGFLSDHLPQLSTIPCGQDTLRVISWNVHIQNMGSGFNIVGETNEQYSERAQNITNSLKLFTDQERPDVILLQEAQWSDSPEFIAKLQEQLGESWGIICSNPPEKGGLVTIYNKNKLLDLSPKENKENPNNEKEEIPFQRCLFKLKNSIDETSAVAINNVHLLHADDPQKTEDDVKKILRESSADGHHVIVGGDFNCRYAHPSKMYLPNNVVNGRFREPMRIALSPGDGEEQEDYDRTQGCDWTDGFFYASPSEASQGKCHLPKTMDTLDPNTGKVYEEKMVPFDQMHAAQQAELSNPRPCLACAEEYSIEREYGAYAKQWLEDEGIIIHVEQRSANAYNQQSCQYVRYLTPDEKYKSMNPAAMASNIADFLYPEFIKILIVSLKKESENLPPNSALQEAAKKVVSEARNAYSEIERLNAPGEDRELDEAMEGRQKLAASLVHAITVIKNPKDTKAIQELEADARQTVGASNPQKRLKGALMCLAGVAIVALGLAGAIPTMGASLTAAYAGGTLLFVGGAALFQQGRQKSLSASLFSLSKAANDNVIKSAEKQPLNDEKKIELEEGAVPQRRFGPGAAG